MKDEKDEPRGNYEKDTPKVKDIVIVLLVTALLLSLCYIGWYKFGWFH